MVRSSNMNKRVRSLTKFKTIQPSFPLYGKTTARTQVMGTETITFTNGFAAVGVMSPTDYFDPFGTMNAVGIDGTLDTDSLFEAGGHDVIGLIYTAYRSIGSTYTWKVTHNEFLTVTVAGHDITNNTSATASIAATTESREALHNFWIVIIPTADTNTPASSWHECLNHPLAIKKLVIVHANTNKGGSIRCYIPNHPEFIGRMFRDSATDQFQALRWIDMDSGAGDGQEVILHCFLCTQDGTFDGTQAYIYDMHAVQDILVSKLGVDDTDLGPIMGDHAVPTVTS